MEEKPESNADGTPILYQANPIKVFARRTIVDKKHSESEDGKINVTLNEQQEYTIHSSDHLNIRVEHPGKLVR